MKTKSSSYISSISIKFFIIALCSVSTAHAQNNFASSLDAGIYNNRLAAQSVLFTENKGQIIDRTGIARPDILFTGRSAGAKVFLTANSIDYQFEETIFPEGYELDERRVRDREKQEKLRRFIKTQSSHFTLFLKGANLATYIRKEEQNDYTENFFFANCSITGVHTYQRLVYENVYPGIDWVIYSKAKGLEYDFILHPGADPDLIRLDVKDAKKVSIAADGGLVILTELGEVKESSPISYCKNAKVTTIFQHNSDGTIGFDIDTWDKSKVLRIDPAITWSTYYGGTNSDIGESCTVDALGNVFLAGYTLSTSGIAIGGFQNSISSGYDAFLVKFNSSGTRLWATYYGSSDNDYCYHCTVDPSGNIYLAGTTYSSIGMGFNGFRNSNAGGADAFLAKINTNGGLIWATYYGGNSFEEGNSCVTDTLGNVYLSGFTYSSNGIASNGFQYTLSGGSDLFLVKFNSAGNRLWATYYGGNNLEYGGCYSADISGNVFLTGSTYSTVGIASGGFQNTLSGGSDAFLVKLNSSGSRIWATYYGGTNDDYFNSSSVDTSGNIYATGVTNSVSGISFNGFQNSKNESEDAFLVKFKSNGTRDWATYFGGNGSEYQYGTATDVSGNVYISGQTYSDTNVAYNGFKDTFGLNPDAYIAKFKPNGNLLWASYFGGNQDDYGYVCATDTSGNVYLSGYTTSPTGIAYGGFQNVNRGSGDAFVAKINGSGNADFISIADGNWNNPAIWSGGVIPSAGSIVRINTAVRVTAPAVCYSIRVSRSGSITVSPGINLNVLH